MVPRLLDKIHELGYEATLGDAFRDPRAFGQMGKTIAYGKSYSCHKLRLAIDINLFKDGKYLSSTKDHQPIGEWWESIGGSWGGRFNDGNHYSLEYDGFR